MYTEYNYVRWIILLKKQTKDTINMFNNENDCVIITDWP